MSDFDAFGRRIRPIAFGTPAPPLDTPVAHEDGRKVCRSSTCQHPAHPPAVSTPSSLRASCGVCGDEATHRPGRGCGGAL